MSIRRWPSTSGSAAARPATSAASGSDPVSTWVLNSPRTYRQPSRVTAAEASARDSLVCSMPPIVPALPLRGERDPRSTSANLAARTVLKLSPEAGLVAASGSVIATSLFESAPYAHWSQSIAQARGIIRHAARTQRTTRTPARPDGHQRVRPRHVYRHPWRACDLLPPRRQPGLPVLRGLDTGPVGPPRSNRNASTASGNSSAGRDLARRNAATDV